MQTADAAKAQLSARNNLAHTERKRAERAEMDVQTWKEHYERLEVQLQGSSGRSGAQVGCGFSAWSNSYATPIRKRPQSHGGIRPLGVVQHVAALCSMFKIAG